MSQAISAHYRIKEIFTAGSHDEMMVLRAFLIFALASSSTACSAGITGKAETPLPGVKSPGGGGIPVTYVGAAPDSVVTYSFWRGFGPKGGDRVTVWRHGHLFRQQTEYIGSRRATDPAIETSYANLATGASADGILRGPGERSGFTLRRETARTRTQYRYELKPTAEMRTIAGERCTVWRADPIGEPNRASTGVARRSCLADDGVVLYDAWLYSGGAVAEERIATNVELRKVAPGEALPPRAALDWAMWAARAKDLKPNPTGRPLNYELELRRVESQDAPDSPGRLRYKAAGGWELLQEWPHNESQQFSLAHSDGLRVTSDSDTLGIYFAPRQTVPSGDFGSGPVGKAGSALGETCTWFDAAAGVSDYSRLECRSKDGLPLIIKETSWGSSIPTLTAVRLSRGKTPSRALMPPVGMFDWAAWGWPELAK